MTLLIALLGAWLGLVPQTPAAAPVLTHDAIFEVQGTTYTGGAAFAVDKSGAVTGALRLTDPATVQGTLGGTVKDGTWTFSYPFTMDNQGQACAGTVSGSAKVPAALDEITGPVTIAADCSPDPLTGTFVFRKKK